MRKKYFFIVILFFCITLLASFLIFTHLSFATFNFLEAIFWLLIGAWIITLFHFVAKMHMHLAYTLAFLFSIFAITDLIEIYTGAFWQPWWLLVLNIMCVGGILLTLFLYFIKK